MGDITSNKSLDDTDDLIFTLKDIKKRVDKLEVNVNGLLQT